MDPLLIKGHFFLGQALIEFGQYDDATKHLQRAQDLAKDHRLNFGDDIACQLRLAKKRRWAAIEEKRIREEIELQTYLNNLIEKDRQSKLEALRKGENVDEEKLEKNSQSINSTCDKHASDLNAMFATLDIRRKVIIINFFFSYKLRSIEVSRKLFLLLNFILKIILDFYFSQKREVPDYLCGRISFEILKDPVITPSGITYDRKDIEEHLQRVGHFDPVTRKNLTADKLIPNLAMKEVVDAFLIENEWASEY